VVVPTVLGKLRPAFPKLAAFQGVHFKYAWHEGVWLIEIKFFGKYFYWLLQDGEAKLINASQESRLRRMQTIGDSFSL
jgi:hypothetical protein